MEGSGMGNGDTWILIQKEQDIATNAWLVCGMGEAFEDAYAM